DHYARCLGLAFQIRDDLLDVEGETGVIGKAAGADARLSKATWPLLFGIEKSRERCDELLADGLESLQVFGDSAAPLEWLANYIVDRAL
ncbi:MAG: polyprenyl synthetase family protein, partial [Woeseia sp.]